MGSLRERNPLRYDNAITFTEEDHTYKYNYLNDNGEEVNVESAEIVSVSGVLKYGWDEPPLDHMAAAVYGGLMNRYFKYVETLKTTTGFENINRLADAKIINVRIPSVQHEIYYGTKHKNFLLYLICVHENKCKGGRNVEYYDELFLYLLSVNKIKPSEAPGYYEFNTQKYSMVPDVRAFWNLQAQKGTNMHKLIEDYLDVGRLPDVALEPSYDFYRWKGWYDVYFTHLEMEVFRIEVRVFNLAYKLAGSIDCVCKNKDGTYTLIDWKRVGKIEENYKNTKGYNPVTYELLNNVLPQEFDEDCTFGGRKIDKYLVQLSLYKFLFETSGYGVVSRLMIVCLEPRGTTAVDIYIGSDLNKLNKQAAVLLSKRRELLDFYG